MADIQEKLRGATEANNFQMVEQLLREGADIDKQYYSYSALGIAIYHAHVEMVQFLLDHGANVYAPAYNGELALKFAKDKGYDSIVRLLEKVEFERLAKETPQWSLFGSSKLEHIEISPLTGRKLTEIFNFESRLCLLIHNNLHTDAETVFPPVSFDDLPEQYVAKALDEFKVCGGVADEEFVLHGKIQLRNKSALER